MGASAPAGRRTATTRAAQAQETRKGSWREVFEEAFDVLDDIFD
jgi:hypothetical protein